MTSGIAPWLEDCVWPTVEIRKVAKLGTGHTPSRQRAEYWRDCDVPWFTLADVWQLREGTNVVHATAEKISELGVANSSAVVHPPGTVVLSRTASVGFSGILGVPMATSQDFATWTCGPQIIPEFLLLVLRAMADDLRRVAQGSTHRTVYMPDLEQLRTPIPPLEAQRQIVERLEVELSEMDAMEEQLQRIRKLLDDRTLSFTRETLLGARAHARRQRISLDWLEGEMPHDWSAAPVYSRFEVQLGRMLNAARSSGDHMRPYIRNVNVRWDRVDVTDLAEMDFPPAERLKYRLRAGDLLVNEGGAGVGRAAVWDGRIDEIYIQKSVHRVRSRGDDDVRWLAECLRVAVASDIFKAAGNAAIPHFPAEQFRFWRVPLPPPAEQRRLVDALAEMRRDAETAHAAAARQLKVLHERRSCLVAEAVAGGLDEGRAA